MLRNVRASRAWLRAVAVSAVVGMGSIGLVVVAAPAAQAAGGSYTVTSTGDQPDANPGDGTCLSTGLIPTCTLRAALTEANLDGGPSNVSFLIPGTGPQTITIGSALPLQQDGSTTIDGYTQPGSSVNTDPLVDNAQIGIEITSNAVKTANGVQPAVTGPDALDFYHSSNNVVRGIAFYNLRLAIDVNGGAGNVIVGNFIGTNAAGTYHNTVTNSNTFGVVLEGEGANNNIIGRPNAADRNVLSGNSGRGLYTANFILDNVMQNNIVGLNPAGTAQLANSDHGIDLNGGTTRTIVGGTGPMEGNLISGNDGHGIEVSHSPTTVGNQIVGNRIGTDPTGNSGPAYAQNGIRYGHEEVHTEDHVTGTIIAYNIIGNTTLGGIKIDSFSAGTQIHDNKIGVSANGTSIPNGPYGIQIEEGSHDTVVGPNNIIANNRVGIRIQDGTTDLCQVSGGCPAVNNTITQNSIYNNDRLGIDIAPLDVINDASVTSPNNNNAHFPVLSAATSTSVTGTTCASCKVELFVADGTTTDPSLESSYGEGKTFLASGNADGSGNFSLAIAASSTSRLVTSTATDSTGNTSEFSRNIVVPASTDLVNDSFTRTVASGWGTADVGGAYTPQTDPANFAVNGTQGTISVPASTDQAIDLLGTSAKDVDLRATVNTDHLPADGNHIVSLVARRQDATVSYRVGLRFDSSGSVFARVESGATLLGEGLLGLTNDGSPIRLRAQVTGANPTTIKLRAWSAAATEPSTWAVTVTDGTVGPQISGTTGVRATSTSTTGPVLVTVDNFSVSPVPAPK